MLLPFITLNVQEQVLLRHVLCYAWPFTQVPYAP